MFDPLPVRSTGGTGQKLDVQDIAAGTYIVNLHLPGKDTGNSLRFVKMD